MRPVTSGYGSSVPCCIVTLGYLPRVINSWRAASTERADSRLVATEKADDRRLSTITADARHVTPEQGEI